MVLTVSALDYLGADQNICDISLGPGSVQNGGAGLPLSVLKKMAQPQVIHWDGGHGSRRETGSDTGPKVFTASAAPTVSSLMSVDAQCARLECPLDFHLIRTSDGPSSTQEGKWAARPQGKGPLMGPRLLTCDVHGAPSRGRGANDPHPTAAEARTPRGCPHSAQGHRPPLPTPEYTVPPFFSPG